MLLFRKNHTLSIFLLILLAFLTSACGAPSFGDNGQVQQQAQNSFQQFATSAGIPYQNVAYEILNNDGTYATVKITAQFRVSQDSDWTDHETTIQCRKVGTDWQCDQILTMNLTQAEVQKQLANQSVSATATVQSLQNIQNAIKVEVIGSPSFGQTFIVYGLPTRDLMFNVQIANNDSQPHSICLYVIALVKYPEAITQNWQSDIHNPNTWFGYTPDPKDPTSGCKYQIGANTTKTLSIGIGGGQGGDPSGSLSGAMPINISNVSDLTFVQLCAQVNELDGQAASIEWRQDPSQDCPHP